MEVRTLKKSKLLKYATEDNIKRVSAVELFRNSGSM